MDVQSWQAFFTNLSTFFLRYENYKPEDVSIDRMASTGYSARHYLSTLLEIQQFITRSLSDCDLDEDEVAVVRDILFVLQKLEHSLTNIIASISQKEDLLLRTYGTTKTLNFSLEQMCYLRSIGLTWTRISSLFGVSRMTYFKRKEMGILNDFKYSTISDTDLEAKVQEIKNLMPDIGESMLGGILRSNGVCVQCHRIRKALHSIEPIKVALRWNSQIKRRTYSVPGSMSLWHIGK